MQRGHDDAVSSRMHLKAAGNARQIRLHWALAVDVPRQSRRERCAGPVRQ
jgi:hypothetical protein